MVSIASTVRTSLARQSCTALAPSVIEPPPTVTMRSAFAGCDHGLARGVRRHRIEQADAAGTQRVADLADLVGLPVQRARDHQERPRQPQAVQLRDDRLRGGPAEHDLVHRAENDTPLVHAVLPGTLFSLARQSSGGDARWGTLKWPGEGRAGSAGARSPAMRPGASARQFVYLKIALYVLVDG
jgi:hypothetical protein